MAASAKIWPNDGGDRRACARRIMVLKSSLLRVMTQPTRAPQAL